MLTFDGGRGPWGEGRGRWLNEREQLRGLTNHRGRKDARKVGRWWRLFDWLRLRRTVDALELEVVEARARADAAYTLATETATSLEEYRGSFRRLSERIHELESAAWGARVHRATVELDEKLEAEAAELEDEGREPGGTP